MAENAQRRNAKKPWLLETNCALKVPSGLSLATPRLLKRARNVESLVSARMTYSTMSPTIKSFQEGISCNVGKDHIRDMECSKRQNGGKIQLGTEFPTIIQGVHLGDVITEHPWECE